MSAKTMSSLADENRDFRKQIGCMNGIFQIFDRQHFLTGRRISSHSNKRLIQGTQHQLDQQYAKKAVMFQEKGVEVQKDKPRNSTESSRASFSSSSCSSTFSSLDFNRTVQPETLSLRQINIPESPFQTTATKDRQPSLNKGMQSHDLRDVVKDSMYREVRSLSIKSLSNDERGGTVMKHIDSPRPIQQTKTGNSKGTVHAGSPRVLAKVQDSTRHPKDEQLALPRFSYDGRESREIYKSAMKHKENPRLSLDSKTGTAKAFESRLNFLGRDLHVGNDATSSQVVPLNQELGSNNRTSSVVAKLMGLDAFPDRVSSDDERTPTIKSCHKEALRSQLTSTAEESKQNQANYSPRFSQINPASPSPKLHGANFARKPTTCSRFPVEPAPWRQQDSSQGSPKQASKSRRALTNTLHQTCSVYGEIEKRITKLEFNKSGKDLRALKQILEAMQKTRVRLEDQRGESAELNLDLEDGCSDQNSNLSIWKNRKTYQQAPPIKGPNTPRQLGSVVIMKPSTKVTDKVKLSVSSQVPTTEISHLQRLQTRATRYNRGSSAHGRKANDLPPESNSVKYRNRNLPTTDKTSWSPSEGPQHMRSENCTTHGRSSGTVSPRLQRNLLRIEGQSHSTTSSADSGRVKKQCSKKPVEKGSQNRKIRVKAKDHQLSDDQLSELSTETRYSSYQGDTASVKSDSNNSLVSQTETEVISLGHSINTTTRQKENSASTTKHMPAVESAITMLEQPSPISVLDDTFYCEDSPSPVKKISTVFQDDSPSLDEAEWHLETLNHLTDSTRSNQKLENMSSGHTLTLLNVEPDGTAANHNGSLNPDHRYIRKILLTSGLLKDSSFISKTNHSLSSHHLINPDMFHILEQTEEIREAMNGGIIEKNDRMKLNDKIQRKIIFDMVDEILVRKVTSGKLFTVGKNGTSSQWLLKEVYLEVDRMCRIPDCNLDEEDEMIRLLSADMMHGSEDWVSYSGEVPALVLDIERLIFKDLINEVVTGEVKDLPVRPKRHCRQLFSN